MWSTQHSFWGDCLCTESWRASRQELCTNMSWCPPSLRMLQYSLFQGWSLSGCPWGGAVGTQRDCSPASEGEERILGEVCVEGNLEEQVESFQKGLGQGSPAWGQARTHSIRSGFWGEAVTWKIVKDETERALGSEAGLGEQGPRAKRPEAVGSSVAGLG